MIRMLALCLLTATPATADSHLTPLPPLPEAKARAWPAIGRIFDADRPDRGFCTGTLVAPNIVLTAAHCAAFTPAPDPADQNLFLAGAFNDNTAATRRIVQTLHHPSYPKDGPHAPAFDVGLWILDSPITDIAPIPLGRSATDPLALLGYHRLLPFRLSGRTDCPRGPDAPGLIVLGCRVISGNSGSPVLDVGAQGTTLIAVTSSQSGANAIAVPIGAWVTQAISTHRSDAD